MTATTAQVDFDAAYIIEGKWGGVLEVKASGSKGAELGLSEDFGESCQRWKFIVAPGTEAQENLVLLVPQHEPTLCVDLTMPEGAPIIWDIEAEGNPAQRFQLLQDDGSVSLKSAGNDNLFILAGEDKTTVRLAPESHGSFLLRPVVPAAAATGSSDATPAAVPATTEPTSPPTAAEPAPAAASESQPPAAVEASPSKDTKAEPTPTKAAKPATPPPMEPASGAPSGMTREAFLRTMGLAPEDLSDPAVQKDVVPSRFNPDDDIDEIAKRADFTDHTLLSAPASNEYRQAQLEKFRVTSSGREVLKSAPPGSMSPGATAASNPLADHDPHAAMDYKAKMLADFRSRKEVGATKRLEPRSSPRREKPTEEAAAGTP